MEIFFSIFAGQPESSVIYFKKRVFTEAKTICRIVCISSRSEFRLDKT